MWPMIVKRFPIPSINLCGIKIIWFVMKITANENDINDILQMFP